MTETNTPLTADGLWNEATELFSNFKAMRPRSSWLTGLSVSAGRGRLERLKTSKPAKALLPKLDALPDDEFSVFRSYAQVNLEQAESAVRLSLVANITIPLGFLVVANQFFPGIVRSLVDYTGADAMLLGLVSAGTLLFIAIWYCYAGVFQARAIDHLTTIAAARRGLDANGGGLRSRRKSADEDAPTDSVEQLL